MLVKSDANKENEIINELASSDKNLLRQHNLFEAEMAFKQELIEARKSRNLTQNDVSNLTGLSQQAVSRLENGSGGTLSTIMRYLNSMGYSLTIKKSHLCIPYAHKQP